MGDLVSALPCSENFRITTAHHHYRERLLMRLGLPIPVITSGKCLCKNGFNDVEG